MKTFLNIFLFLALFLNCNSNREEKYILGSQTSAVKYNMALWYETIDIETVNRPCSDMDIRFVNNPFGFEDEYICIFIHDSMLVYRGNFSYDLDVCIPDSLIGKTLLPTLTVFKNGNTYNFLGKSYVEILPDDKYLNIVFMPERGVHGGCLMFANRVELPR